MIYTVKMFFQHCMMSHPNVKSNTVFWGIYFFSGKFFRNPTNTFEPGVLVTFNYACWTWLSDDNVTEISSIRETEYCTELFWAYNFVIIPGNFKNIYGLLYLFLDILFSANIPALWICLFHLLHLRNIKLFSDHWNVLDSKTTSKHESHWDETGWGGKDKVGSSLWNFWILISVFINTFFMLETRRFTSLHWHLTISVTWYKPKQEMSGELT